MSSGYFIDKTAIVTGAAGNLGRAAALRLAVEGAAVLVVDRDRERLAETVSAIETEGGTARAFVADVTAPSSVQACVEEAKRLGNGTVGAFFNNAGVEGLVAPIDAYPQDAFDQVIAVNVRSVYLGLKYVAQVMGNGGDIRAALLSGVSLGWPMGGLGSWTGGQ